MLTSDVMPWSPSGKGEVTLSRTVAQWIPSEEYQERGGQPGARRVGPSGEHARRRRQDVVHNRTSRLG